MKNEAQGGDSSPIRTNMVTEITEQTQEPAAALIFLEVNWVSSRVRVRPGWVGDVLARPQVRTPWKGSSPHPRVASG